MKAEELRKGNIIRHTVHGIIAIEGVWSQKVKDGNYETVYYNKEWHLLGHCAPIELTPEILGKIEDFAQHGDMLGMWYIRQGDDKQHFIGIMSTDKYPDFYSMFLVSHENDRIAVKRVQYLHEVQNFTYEVTNTELSITL